MRNVLIIGAGPVGLTAAIELTRQGVSVKIIDKKAAHEPMSKALAINPHTLKLLEPSDVTASLLAAGLKVQKACFSTVTGQQVKLNLSQINQRYNFILILPQYETETILERHLNNLGVKVEYNTELVEFTQNSQQVIAKLKQNDLVTEYKADYLIGADGAHSLVRHDAGFTFEGKTYKNEWYLADVQLAADYDITQVQMHILPGYRILGLIPIKPRLFRILGNHEQLFDQLPDGFKIEKVLWQSAFKINCRQVNSYQQGRVFLAGDAAHIHSPAGGRGMNLGIEDAVILARKIVNNDLANYTQLREPAGRRVIKLTDFITRMLTQRNPFLIFMRDHVFFSLLKLPALQRRMIRNMLGGD